MAVRGLVGEEIHWAKRGVTFQRTVEQLVGAFSCEVAW